MTSTRTQFVFTSTTAARRCLQQLLALVLAFARTGDAAGRDGHHLSAALASAR